jgi:hypothetical protein
MTSYNTNTKTQPGSIAYIFSREVFRRNCVLAVVVGCLLTIANQLDVLLSQPFSFRLGSKIVFNFLIPFVVSSTSTAWNRNSNKRPSDLRKTAQN